ncbi:glutamate--tRNA ligase [Bacillus thuringiensis]|uniref:glutamate--tRNA ligase n=1 Tax=Bacillus thuringiensis TaxID=1428 RepID=UPI000BF2F242|nr:glutamate--tRNA ligase [Bacillus thuringiensis]PES33321.1 glutamate--tRNA ligase [Bacillus thuringiensis]
MDHRKLANILFPDLKYTIHDYEKIYPKRKLNNSAKVTRIAPSPTGFIHLGNLFSAIINERLARKSGGIFFLRIEDTDNKREVPGAVDKIKSTLKYFGISFDEGPIGKGEYGPYCQRERVVVYHAFAKALVEKGFAYPCFCTESQLSEMREKQRNKKLNLGYYGDSAIHRNSDFEDIEQKIANKEPYVLRFRSGGDVKHIIKIADAIRGEITLQENYQDFILLKSDGIPTYHFAHVVDDHLMGTTHVVRGEEWLPSLPMHVQLFEAFEWQLPVYCHTAQLMKFDGSSKRKLSKRKDPEIALEYYISEGYDPSAVWEYLLTILNSNFEEWRILNPNSNIGDFPFSVGKLSKSGALFDLKKLNDISKNIISRMSVQKVYNNIETWALKYDMEFAEIFTLNPSYSVAALTLCTETPRKDIMSWKQAKGYLSFFYDETFKIEDDFPIAVNIDDRKSFFNKFLETYNYSDDKSTWFNKIVNIAVEMGYAGTVREYKNNPHQYKGHIGDINGVLRVCIVGRLNSPDLWSICKIIGDTRVRNRVLSQTFSN